MAESVDQLTCFQQYLGQLLEQTGESYRKASLAAGLHQGSVSNYMGGVQPSRDACIALADHFGVHPNEMLQAAGYEPLALFNRWLGDPDQMSHEVRTLAGRIEAIRSPQGRALLLNTIEQVVELYEQLSAVGPEDDPICE